MIDICLKFWINNLEINFKTNTETKHKISMIQKVGQKIRKSAYVHLNEVPTELTI